MSWSGRRSLAVLLLSCALITAAPSAGQVLMEIPEDPRDKLNTLDETVLTKQRELFAARQRNDAAAIEKLSKEFDEIQRQRKEIVKKAGHLF